MTDNAQSNTEEYKGGSSVELGWGRSSIESMVGLIVGGVAGAATVGTLVLASAEKTMKAFSTKSKGDAVSRGALLGGIVGMVLGQVTGFFSGMKKAEEGRAQFENIKGQRDQAIQAAMMLQNQAQGLQGQVQGLISEVGTERKRFTDLVTQQRTSHTPRADHAALAGAESASAAHPHPTATHSELSSAAASETSVEKKLEAATHPHPAPAHLPIHSSPPKGDHSDAAHSASAHEKTEHAGSHAANLSSIAQHGGSHAALEAAKAAAPAQHGV
jgi:hypothetical protein